MRTDRVPAARLFSLPAGTRSNEFHAQAHHVAALHAVFEDRRRAVLAEIVYVDAAADESAAFVEGDLPESRIARADFEQAEPRPAGRVDGVGQKGRGDALPLTVGHDGDIHDLGREGPRVDQHVLSDDPAVVAGGVARSAADVVGHRGFDLVGQQQQFPRRGFGFANFRCSIFTSLIISDYSF